MLVVNLFDKKMHIFSELFLQTTKKMVILHHQKMAI